MTKAELVVKVTLAANGKLTRKRAETLVDAVFENLRTAIVEDGAATLRHVGRWSTRTRRARRGFDPHARRPIRIEAAHTVAFDPAPAFVARLSGRKQ
jgi:nucleoid DNA-binding protein